MDRVRIQNSSVGSGRESGNDGSLFEIATCRSPRLSLKLGTGSSFDFAGDETAIGKLNVFTLPGIGPDKKVDFLCTTPVPGTTVVLKPGFLGILHMWELVLLSCE